MGGKTQGPLFLTWAYLVPEALEEIASLQSKPAIRAKLAQQLGIDRDDGYPTEILKDFHFNNYAFCKQNGFTFEKTATFLSVMKLVQEESCRSRLSAPDCFDQLFKPWLLKHAVQRPPLGVGIFSFEEIRLLTEYTMNTFFRHFKLYSYVYVPHRELEFEVLSNMAGEPIPWNAALQEQDEIADPKALPELAYVFKDEQEQRARVMADAMFEELERQRDLGEAAPEVKSEVDRKVSALMKSFDQKLKEQDEKFEAMING